MTKLDAPLQLYFIRHGETAWSLTGQHTGRTDLPLTAHGKEQARQLAPWLGDIDFSHVLTSPRARAQQTCKLAGLGANATVDPDLAEWDYGDYEGMRSPDIREMRPDWNVFGDGCPSGEAPCQILQRADRLIARLRLLKGNVALFSHGQFGALFGARWIGLPVIAAQNLMLRAPSLCILGFNPSHPEVPVIELWNALRPGHSAAFGLVG